MLTRYRTWGKDHLIGIHSPFPSLEFLGGLDLSSNSEDIICLFGLMHPPLLQLLRHEKRLGLLDIFIQPPFSNARENLPLPSMVRLRVAVLATVPQSSSVLTWPGTRALCQEHLLGGGW